MNYNLEGIENQREMVRDLIVETLISCKGYQVKAEAFIAGLNSRCKSDTFQSFTALEKAVETELVDYIKGVERLKSQRHVYSSTRSLRGGIVCRIYQEAAKSGITMPPQLQQKMDEASARDHPANSHNAGRIPG